MTRLLTRIMIPGEPHGHGIMDWGELTAEEMIARYRARAAYLRKQAEAIEAADDSDFQIDVVRGSLAEHHVRAIQPGKSNALAAGSRRAKTPQAVECEASQSGSVHEGEGRGR